jgi:type IV secretion system protein VirB11
MDSDDFTFGQAEDYALMVRHLLQPLQPWLDQDDVLEICVNRPGEVWVERHQGWDTPHAVPALSFDHCVQLAIAVATSTSQIVGSAHPLLGAVLPDGERVQFALPPAVPRDTVSITIRRPSSRLLTLDDLAAGGLFQRVAPPSNDLQPHEKDLRQLLKRGLVPEFLKLAVATKQNMLVGGHTGCGKTTILKALAELIPLHERLFTVESAAELLTPHHRNAVHLFWSDGGQSVADVTPHDLLMAALRGRPDRVLLAETRGPEAYYMIRFGMSGHPGSMTTLHSKTPRMAFDQLSMMVQESPQGRGIPDAKVEQLLRSNIDIVLQFGNNGSGRFVQEIWYDPEGKRDVAPEAQR